MTARLSQKQKIVNRLRNGREYTVEQLAAHAGTTEATVAARISDLRNEGFSIYTNRNGYRMGRPSRAVVAAGRNALITA